MFKVMLQSLVLVTIFYIVVFSVFASRSLLANEVSSCVDSCVSTIIDETDDLLSIGLVVVIVSVTAPFLALFVPVSFSRSSAVSVYERSRRLLFLWARKSPFFALNYLPTSSPRSHL